MPFIALPGGKVGCMGTAIKHGDSKTLCRTYHHIGTPLSWRGDQYQTHQVGNHSNCQSVFMGRVCKSEIVPDLSVGCRILNQASK